MNAYSDALSLIGRIFLAVIFLVSGFGKIGGFEGLVGPIASKGFPVPQAFAVATIVIEVGVALDAGSRLEGALGRISAGGIYRDRHVLLSQLLGQYPKRRK